MIRIVGQEVDDAEQGRTAARNNAPRVAPEGVYVDAWEAGYDEERQRIEGEDTEPYTVVRRYFDVDADDDVSLDDRYRIDAFTCRGRAEAIQKAVECHGASNLDDTVVVLRGHAVNLSKEESSAFNEEIAEAMDRAEYVKLHARFGVKP